MRLYSDDFVKKNEPQSLVLPYDSQMAAETTCPPLAKPLKLEHDNPITRSLNAFGIKGSGASDPKYAPLYLFHFNKLVEFAIDPRFKPASNLGTPAINISD